jgi:hypothetical protein
MIPKHVFVRCKAAELCSIQEVCPGLLWRQASRHDLLQGVAVPQVTGVEDSVAVLRRVWLMGCLRSDPCLADAVRKRCRRNAPVRSP